MILIKLAIISFILLMTMGCLNQKTPLNKVNSAYQLEDHQSTAGRELAQFTSNVSKEKAEEYFSNWCKSHGYKELDYRNDTSVLAIMWVKSDGYCSINIREEQNQITIQIITASIKGMP